MVQCLLTIRFVPIDPSHKQVSNLEKWCVWPSKKRWIERLFYSVIKLFWMTWLLVGCAAIHKSWSSEKKPLVRHDINPKFTPYCICFEMLNLITILLLNYRLKRLPLSIQQRVVSLCQSTKNPSVINQMPPPTTKMRQYWK